MSTITVPAKEVFELATAALRNANAHSAAQRAAQIDKWTAEFLAERRFGWFMKRVPKYTEAGARARAEEYANNTGDYDFTMYLLSVYADDRSAPAIRLASASRNHTHSIMQVSTSDMVYLNRWANPGSVP